MAMNSLNLDKVFAVFLLVLRLGVEIHTVCTGDELVKFTSPNSVSHKYFFEHGPPIITNTTKCLFDFRSVFVFTPHYTVISMINLEEEGFYVISEDLNNVTYHLYDENHPNGPNYKLNVMTGSIMKCSMDEEDEEKCEELNGCNHHKTVSKAHENVDAEGHVVSIARQKINESEMKMLVQYKNNLFICNDNNAIDVKKLVMHGPTRQNISSTNNAVKYTSNANETLDSENFNFPANKTLNLQISQCAGCSLRLSINCDDYCHTEIFNGTTEQKWIDILLPGPNVTAINCKLTITTRITDTNQTTDRFWAFTPNAIFFNTTLDTTNKNNDNEAGNTNREVNHSNTALTTRICYYVVVAAVLVLLATL